MWLCPTARQGSLARVQAHRVNPLAFGVSTPGARGASIPFITVLAQWRRLALIHDMFRIS
eukprot:2885640-Rhodomonas_salina.1